MKTRKFLWAVLPVMAAALAMTACGGDDVADSKPVPVNPSDKTDVTQKSVPYTVTVTGDPETTRATTDGLDMKFADGDQLYVRNTDGDIHGVLDLQSGAGDGSATFSGDLYYEESNPPTASTSLTATLVSSDDEVAQISSEEKVTGFTYPAENNVCSTLAEAVSKYSQLQGTANYGSTFVLTQSTAFLHFTVTLEDGTTGGASVPVSVTSDGNTTIGTGSVTTSGSNRFFDIQAEFYVPVPYNTTITTDATMCVANVGSDDESITYGGTADKPLYGGKVYNITKTKDFVRLWAGGPVWRSKNVGASSVTEYGGYYAWGGTTDVTSTSINLDWNSNCPHWVSGTTNSTVKFSKYVPTDQSTYWGGEGTTPDNKTELEAEDDAATQALGSPWRMPTDAELNSTTGLLANTTNEWAAVNGKNGRTFTGKDDYAGKAIFLPAAGERVGNAFYDYGEGYYISSSLIIARSSHAYVLYFDSSEILDETVHRASGNSVRPVRN